MSRNRIKAIIQRFPSFSSDYYTEELGEYADRLQEFFVDNLLDVIVDDVFSILYMDKNFLHEFNRQCSEILKL